MATTVTAPVGNTIALAERYLPILDEIYKAGSKSAILDTASERVRWEGAKKASLFNTTLVGLANYDRNAGFVPGDATDGWEDYEITQDRGRSFMVDAMDNDETLGMAFGTLVGEFERTQVIPELDAYRFAKYAGAADATQKITGTLATGASGGALSDTASLGAAGGLVGGIASMLSGQVQQQQLQYELEHTAPQIGTLSVAAPANAFFLDDRARLLITRPAMIPGYDAAVYSHTVGNACAIPGTLSSFSGYTIASAAELSSITARDGSGVSPTAEELRMIKQSLQSGIYV